jgi:hypothetical protein
VALTNSLSVERPSLRVDESMCCCGSRQVLWFFRKVTKRYWAMPKWQWGHRHPVKNIFLGSWSCSVRPSSEAATMMHIPRFRWGKDPASQKTAYRKLYEGMLRSYCPTSEARSLTRAAFTRKFLAVLLKPESFFASFFADKKRRTPSW